MSSLERQRGMPVESYHSFVGKRPSTSGARKETGLCRVLVMAGAGMPHSQSHHAITLNSLSCPPLPQFTGHEGEGNISLLPG